MSYYNDQLKGIVYSTYKIASIGQSLGGSKGWYFIAEECIICPSQREASTEVPVTSSVAVVIVIVIVQI